MSGILHLASTGLAGWLPFVRVVPPADPFAVDHVLTVETTAHPDSDPEAVRQYTRDVVQKALFGLDRWTVPAPAWATAPPAPPPPPAPPAAAASPEESDEDAIRRLFHLGPKDGTYDWCCAFREADLRPQDCRTVLCEEEGENDGDSWLAILWLKDGRFAFLSAGCDYTGWDCQAGGDHHVCDELRDLLLGFVGEQDAKRLQVTMPAGKAAA